MPDLVYIVGAGLCIITAGLLAFSVIFEQKRLNSRKSTVTKELTAIAVFAALCAVVNVFEIPTPLNKISLTMLFALFAGVIFGAPRAFIVCFIGDLVAALIFPQGPYNLILGLTSGLMGFIAGVVFEIRGLHKILKTIIALVIMYLICSVLLNSFALYFMYHLGKTQGYGTYIVYRMYSQLISFGINLVAGIFATIPIIRVKNLIYGRVTTTTVTSNDTKTENK